MTTKRQTTKFEVPIPPSRANGSTKPTNMQPTTTLEESPSLLNSPFLPTALETLLLSLYPLTLLLGSIFSTLHPSTRAATYNPIAQAYDPSTAPSYFARKGNLFNVYFVKIGWFWITLAFSSFVLTHSSLGPPLRAVVTRRRWQAAVRYGLVTLWFFGPPIIDRSFTWTGGKCEMIESETLAARREKAGMSEVEKAFTHAACKGIGGQWRGGHDISGHVFLLILGSAMLWLELLPALLRMEGLREARRVLTRDGLVRSAAIETDADTADGGKEGRNVKIVEETSLGVKAALGVAGMSWWMLLMTAAYFHTWFEKFTGLAVAFTAVYLVYFLPRAVPAMRKVVGLPGV
ncbi:hypothetical protein LTR86_008079 [Recurvomyces mirabilis]|nr:hypothetical protein LTR86_008079 [Recurvomyces mirabilis]